MAVAAVVAARQPRRPQVDPRPTLHANFGRPLPRSGAGSSSGKPTSGGTIAPRPAIVSLPNVASSTAFAGATESEAGGWIPADPWVAASASYVVQVVNNLVRITNRTGGLLAAVPSEVFYNLPGGRLPADSRIIWDASRSRWVGEVVWFLNDFSDNGFTLAVSDGSDPTQGWSLFSIGYGNQLPDFPSLASSSDKVVVADDIFNSSGVFQKADINTFTWASILGGGPLTYNFCDDPGFVHPRAAQVLSPSNDVHLIMEATDGSGDQWYFRLVGSGICTSSTIQVVDGEDLAGLLIPGIQVPPAPRQPGPDTIDQATDGRATDAVWQNGHLWWVATAPVSYDAGATFNDAVGVYTVNTLSSGPPSAASRMQIHPGDKLDAYLGGIGLSRNGTVFVTYTQSSSTTPAAFYSNRIDGSLALGAPLVLDTGDAPITGERWGDYAGIAMDPTGAGAVWATNMVAAGDGSWRTRVARILVDSDSPTTPGAPSATPATASTLTLAPRFHIAWGAATDAGSGGVTYRLERNLDGTGFAPAGTYASPSTTLSLSLGHSYQFRVAAIDSLGHLSAFATGPVLHPSLAQSPTATTGTWHIITGGGYAGGSTWYATAAGATASYATTAVRSLAIISTRAPTRGSFKVYVDGVYTATINCAASITLTRQVMYQVSWSTPGTHTLKIVVSGTLNHPRVDVDAYLIVK
jgi:hypothetical protein